MGRVYSLLLGMSIGVMFNNAFAGNDGYLSTNYGTIIKSPYGQCIHTTYFNSKNGVAECGEAPPKPEPVVIKKIVNETVSVSDADNVLFKFGASTLTSNGNVVLSNLINKIDSESNVSKITIAGYTDSLGRSAYNLQLSIARANTVRQFFIDHGVAGDKIVAEGFGESEATASNGCIKQYGEDPQNKIIALQNKLGRQYKSKKLTKQQRQQKAVLQDQLNSLTAIRNQLIACAAPDRKVLFTIEHDRQVQKTVEVIESAPPANAPVPEID